MFFSTKTYGHEQGLSCCFRQPKAQSHCRLLHGYAISVKLVFRCRQRDENGWVMDFGGLKSIKEWLQSQFDHTVLLSATDPELVHFESLDSMGLIDLRVLRDGVGCEAFAFYIFEYVQEWLRNRFDPVRGMEIYSVEVAEHGGNSAIWKNERVD